MSLFSCEIVRAERTIKTVSYLDHTSYFQPHIRHQDFYPPFLSCTHTDITHLGLQLEGDRQDTGPFISDLSKFLSDFYPPIKWLNFFFLLSLKSSSSTIIHLYNVGKGIQSLNLGHQQTDVLSCRSRTS